MGRIVRISHVTQGFLHELSPGEQEQVVAEFHAQARGRDDWILRRSEGREGKTARVRRAERNGRLYGAHGPRTLTDGCVGRRGAGISSPFSNYQISQLKESDPLKPNESTN